VLENGEVLTEGPAIVQYLADQVPEKKLAPSPGSFERVRLQEKLNFISTEIHKSFSPLFNPAAPEEWKTVARGLIGRRLDVVEQTLAGRDYLLGDFTVADAYLFTVLGWGRMVGVDVNEGRPLLAAYLKRVGSRPCGAAGHARGRLDQVVAGWLASRIACTKASGDCAPDAASLWLKTKNGTPLMPMRRDSSASYLMSSAFSPPLR
jgi:glutathione S-transferase